jgi:hypothetical protein
MHTPTTYDTRVDITDQAYIPVITEYVRRILGAKYSSWHTYANTLPADRYIAACHIVIMDNTHETLRK